MSEIEDAFSADEAAWKERRNAALIALPQENYPYQHQQQLDAAVTIPKGAAKAIPLGWQVVAANHGGTWQWGVWFGRLFDTQGNGGGPIAPTGFLGSLDPADAGWSDIGSAPAKIWLEVAFGTWPAVDSAYINTTDFDGGELEYAFDGGTPPNPIQTFARFMLGEVLAYGSDGSPQLTTEGYGFLKLKNDGDIAFDSGGIGSNPTACPIIYIKAGGAA